MVTVNRCLWWGQQYVAWEKLHGFNWPTMVCSLLSIISLPWISLTLSLKVLVAHSCLTLCNPMDWSLPGSSVHGILHARILEWVAIPFSRGSFWPRGWTWVSCIVGGFFTIWATREAEGIRTLGRWYQLIALIGIFYGMWRKREVQVDTI